MPRPDERRQIAEAVKDLSAEALVQVAGAGAPQSVVEMVRLHLSKPWIPGFLTTLISPLRPGLNRHLRISMVKSDGRIWHFPSAHWWLTHAQASHGKTGETCDPAAHSAFLTAEGARAEFAYGHLMADGRLVVAGPEDFERECAWWRDNFGRAV